MTQRSKAKAKRPHYFRFMEDTQHLRTTGTPSEQEHHAAQKALLKSRRMMMVLPPSDNARKLSPQRSLSESATTGDAPGPPSMPPSSSVSESIRQATVLSHDRDNARHGNHALPIGLNADISRLSSGLDLQRNLDLFGANSRSTISQGLSPGLSQLLAAREAMPFSLQSSRLASLGLDPHLPLHMATASQGMGPSLAETLLARQRQLDSSAFLQYARASRAAAASSALGVEMFQSVARPTTTSPGPLSSLAQAAAGSPALDEGKEKLLSRQTSQTAAGTKESPLYIEKPREWDVLCGRGGRSNHHPGNKRYRQVISEMKARYRNIEAKSAKTDLSRAIVEHVFGYGGRFVKLDKPSGKYEVLSALESRKKTSQALRETKELKWTL